MLSDTCTNIVGLILAKPESFTIVYAATSSWPTMGIQHLFELFVAFAGMVLEGPTDVIDVGRPRCVDLHYAQGR